MSTEKQDPKSTTEPPRIKTTKLPDLETEIPDEELEKATGGRSTAKLRPLYRLRLLSAALQKLGRKTMSNDKVDPSKKDPNISSADNLTKTTKSGDVEMTEEELKRVSGGYNGEKVGERSARILTRKLFTRIWERQP